MSIGVERYDHVKKKFVPWKFSAVGKPEYYFITENLQGDPTSYSDSDEKFSTAEEARLAGIAALEKMAEGVVSIWQNESDAEGNGESKVLWEYRREKTGPSETTEVPLDE